MHIKPAFPAQVHNLKTARRQTSAKPPVRYRAQELADLRGINGMRVMGQTASPYDVLIMDHIRNARNYLVIDDVNRKATGANPLCGDELTVYLRIEHDCIENIAFQCACCGISMASASIMTEMVKKQDITRARMLLQAFVPMLFNRTHSRVHEVTREQRAILETVRKFPSRSGCAVLPWTTLERALDNLQETVLTH